MKNNKFKEYNVHIGDGDRRFKRIETVDAYHSLAAPAQAKIEEGETLLRVARPATDTRRAQQLQCTIEQIYENSPERDRKRNLTKFSKSATSGLNRIRTAVVNLEKDENGKHYGSTSIKIIDS